MVDSTLSVDIGSITAGSFARFSLDSTSRDLTPTYNLVGGPTAPAALLEGCGAQVVWDMGDGNLFSRPVDTASGLGNGFVYTSRISYLYPAVGDFLVSTISFCSCFGLISAASVAVSVTPPPCTDPDYEWHKGLYPYSFWLDKIETQTLANNVRRVYGSIGSYKWLGDGRYPGERAPTPDEHDTVTIDISSFWQNATGTSCGQAYESDIFVFPFVPVVATASSPWILINVADDVGPGRAGKDAWARATRSGRSQWYRSDGLNNAGTPAHEFGHNLGFDDRYTDPNAPRYDIMTTSSTGIVYGALARILWENY